MEFRQLNTFIHVAQFQSFSKAAEHLGYSQSAVTVQIRLLEQELGTRLFDRMGKQIRLTAQGRQMLVCANKILYEINKTRVSMCEEDEFKNPLHIGTIESLSTAKLPPIIHYFRTHYPKVAIRITIASPEELIEMMEHNALDLIYILDTPRWNDNWHQAMEVAEQVVFVSSPRFALAKKRELSLTELLDAPFFLTEKNANYRQALDQHLAGRKQSLSPYLESSDTAFIITMLEQNEGVSFLPYFAVQHHIQSGRLCKLDVVDTDIVMYRQIFYHKSKFKTREMEQFIRLATEEENILRNETALSAVSKTEICRGMQLDEEYI